MNILVTGGLGTVGAGLMIKELITRGHQVVSYDMRHDADEIGFRLGSDWRRHLKGSCWLQFGRY